MVAVQALHGFTFGAFYTASVSYLASRAPPHLRSSAQALYVMVTFGVGGLVGFITAGVGYDWLGSRGLFVAGRGAGSWSPRCWSCASGGPPGRDNLERRGPPHAPRRLPRPRRRPPPPWPRLRADRRRPVRREQAAALPRAGDRPPVQVLQGEQDVPGREGGGHALPPALRGAVRGAGGGRPVPAQEGRELLPGPGAGAVVRHADGQPAVPGLGLPGGDGAADPDRRADAARVAHHRVAGQPDGADHRHGEAEVPGGRGPPHRQRVLQLRDAPEAAGAGGRRRHLGRRRHRDDGVPGRVPGPRGDLGRAGDHRRGPGAARARQGTPRRRPAAGRAGRHRRPRSSGPSPPRPTTSSATTTPWRRRRGCRAAWTRCWG